MSSSLIFRQSKYLFNQFLFFSFLLTVQFPRYLQLSFFSSIFSILFPSFSFSQLYLIFLLKVHPSLFYLSFPFTIQPFLFHRFLFPPFNSIPCPSFPLHFPLSLHLLSLPFPPLPSFSKCHSKPWRSNERIVYF